MSATELAEKVQTIVERFADDAADVDRADAVPVGHFDLLADAGLYGPFAPVELGGLGLSLAQLCAVVEELASACLATTFVWVQHFRLLAAVLDPSAPEIVCAQQSRVVSGQVRGGVSLGGLMPGPARLSAVPAGEGWSLRGETPWVSGWGLVDTLVVAARGPRNTVVTLVLDAKEQSGLVATRRRLSALDASVTVRLEFDGLTIGEERVLGQYPFDPSREAPEGLRVNGSLALGVTRRCCALLGPTSLDDELNHARAELDGADASNMPAARARANELAVRASHAVAVTRGSSSVLTGDISERTAREAQLLLTFGSRPAIRHSLLERFGVGDVS
jgi:alkylation response protein AidB-like acyl-CoA dehydrogenase